MGVSQLAMGKIMEQGPVLIITFQAQVVMVIRSSKGEVVEGDPVSTLAVKPTNYYCFYFWFAVTLDIPYSVHL